MLRKLRLRQFIIKKRVFPFLTWKREMVAKRVQCNNCIKLAYTSKVILYFVYNTKMLAVVNRLKIEFLVFR